METNRETEKERLREGETETKMETWRDRESLQGERKRDTPTKNGTEAERDGVGEVERSTDRERRERRKRPMATPSSHSQKQQGLASSFFHLESPICTPRDHQKGWWPPSCSRDTSCPSALSLAHWQDLSSSQGPDPVLSSSGSTVPSHKCRPGTAQME